MCSNWDLKWVELLRNVLKHNFLHHLIALHISMLGALSSMFEYHTWATLLDAWWNTLTMFKRRLKKKQNKIVQSLNDEHWKIDETPTWSFCLFPSTKRGEIPCA